MKRPGRWLLNALTALSLLLCVAAMALWIRSGFVPGEEWVGWMEAGSPGRAIALGSGEGAFVFATDGGWPLRGQWMASWVPWAYNSRPDLFNIWHTAEWTTGAPPTVRARGWGYGLVTYTGVLAPLWMKRPTPAISRTIYVGEIRWVWLAAVTSVLPLLTATRLTRRAIVTRRRRRVGHCSTCGYDLTGNVSGACPECGTAIVKGNA